MKKQLVYSLTGKPVELNDQVWSRGEEFTVTDIVEPHSINSTGRIYVRHNKEEWTQGYFPSVFDCEWKEV